MRREDPATVDDDEVRGAQGRVVEHRLQEQRVGPGGAEEVAGALERVHVHRHAEPAGFARDVAEEEVLQRLVVGVRRFAAEGT